MPVEPRDVIVSASDLPSDDRAASGGHKLSLGLKLGYRRQHRLLAAAHFKAVFDTRKSVRGTRFVVHFMAASEDTDTPAGARLGLVIPKKQARNAVLRNAIKRQAREAFRHRCMDLPASDFIVRLVQAVNVHDKQTRAAWRAEIDGLFDQASLKLRTGVRV